MMIRLTPFLLPCFLLFFYFPGWSQYPNSFTSGARLAGLGMAGVAISGLDALYANPAGLTRMSGWGINLSIEKRFSLSELRQLCFGAALPLHPGVFALSIKNFGYPIYREQSFALGYARKLLDPMSLGLQFNYQHTRISGYGQSGQFYYQLGIAYEPGSAFRFGFLLLGPASGGAKGSINSSAMARLGLAYRSSDKVQLMMELEKNLNFPLRLKLGLEYAPAPQVLLRTGLISGPLGLSFGVGYRFGHLAFDAASSYHQFLGFSPSLSFNIFEPAKKKDRFTN